MRSLAVCGLLIFVWGCTSVPPVRAPALPITPAAFRADHDRSAKTTPDASPAASPAVSPAISPAVSPADWWLVFADPLLNDWLRRANQNNTQIEAATARLAQAHALLQAELASRSLQVGLNTGLSRQGGPLLNAAGSSGTLATAGVSLSYEVDLPALLSMGMRAGEAALLDTQARASQLAHTRLLVQADVVQSYFSLRAVAAEIHIASAGLQAWREQLQLTQQRYQAGAVAQSLVWRVEAEVAGSSAELLALQRRRAELTHALALWLGQSASAFDLPVGEGPFDAVGMAVPSAQPMVPAVPAGLPSAMLQRRPDVAAAQRAWLAASARAGQARTAWFPTLALTASAGQASASLADLLRASTRSWGLAGLLALPLFDGGRRQAAIEQADAATQAEAAQYRAQVLTAFKEVEDQLVAVHSLKAQAAQQALAAAATQRAWALTQARQQRGGASLLEVLESQRLHLRQQRLTTQVQAAHALATVNLMRALGGGWGGSDGTPAAGTDQTSKLAAAGS
jgi:outer membrane protein, multidrug efflux system